MFACDFFAHTESFGNIPEIIKNRFFFLILMEHFWPTNRLISDLSHQTNKHIVFRLHSYCVLQCFSFHISIFEIFSFENIVAE